MTMINELCAQLEKSVTAKRSQALKLYRELAHRADQPQEDDATILGNVLATLGLTRTDFEADVYAVQQALGAREQVLTPEQVNELRAEAAQKMQATKESLCAVIVELAGRANFHVLVAMTEHGITWLQSCASTTTDDGTDYKALSASYQERLHTAQDGYFGAENNLKSAIQNSDRASLFTLPQLRKEHSRVL